MNEFEAQLQEQVDSSALLTSELEAQITTLETDINQLEEQLQEQVDSSALLSIEIEAQIESASNMPERYTKTGIYFAASNPTPADFNCDALLFAAINTSDVQVNTGETVDISYTLNLD